MNTNVKKAALVSSLKAQVTKRVGKLMPNCGTQGGVTHEHGQSCGAMF